MFLNTRTYGYLGKRQRKFRILPIVAIAVLLVGVVAVQQINQYFFRSSDAQPVAFVVEEGESFAGIAQHLEDEHIIPSAWWFRISAKWAGLDSAVRAGETVVIPGDRSADILGALIYPSGASEVSVTIPEGYTLAQMGEAVRKVLPNISAEDWRQATGVSSSFATDPFVVSAQKPVDVDLEGYLFPDTYRFFTNATAEDVVGRMLRTMESRVAALGEVTGDAQGMTVHELLTLSSIVEREVRHPEDMEQVSDIFLKRLAIGMALQSDATVNYVTGGNDPSISFTDRDLVSPYNTYQNPGLPPGPISNPGMNALRAVWNPAKNAYYYFLTDAEGNVFYAATLEEHIQNKVNHL